MEKSEITGNARNRKWNVVIVLYFKSPRREMLLNHHRCRSSVSEQRWTMAFCQTLRLTRRGPSVDLPAAMRWIGFLWSARYDWIKPSSAADDLPVHPHSSQILPLPHLSKLIWQTMALWLCHMSFINVGGGEEQVGGAQGRMERRCDAPGGGSGRHLDHEKRRTA